MEKIEADRGHSYMKKLLAFFAFVAILLFPSTQLVAQDVSAMTGVVVDSSGAVLPNVTVTLTNKTRGLTFTQTTSGSGSYRFSSIPPGGGYEATFSISGFAPLTVKDISLNVATIRTQNATLIAGMHAEVEVNASNATVTSTRPMPPLATSSK
jgi:hypothetical protein